MKPNINKRFKNLLPPLTQNELERLERSIETDGCRDAIVIWRGPDEVVDGHHRYEICERLKLPYKLSFMDFKDEDEVDEWIKNHHIGRRNLSDVQRTYLLGKRYKEAVGARGGNTGDRENVAEKLAAEADVSATTILTAAKLAEAVDAVAEHSSEAKKKILSGEAEASIKDVVELASQPKKAIKAAAKKLGEGETIEQVHGDIPRKPKLKPPLDDRRIAQAIGELVRAFEARSKLHGKSQDFAACEKALDHLDVAWRRWFAATAK